MSQDGTDDDQTPRNAYPERVQPIRRTRRLRSTELLHPGEDLIIEHAGRDYRLRVTSNGKLILTA